MSLNTPAPANPSVPATKTPTPEIEYAIGADLSFVLQAERDGHVFKDNGEDKPGLQIFKDHGYNWIRLRLFHTPTDLPNDLPYTIELAQQAKKLGFKFLFNPHYSDDWADPGHQITPVAWQDFSHAELCEAVFKHTRDSLIAFGEAEVFPDMVQIGNEVSAGMIWPDGKLPENWGNFVDLTQAGIRGVEAGTGDNPRPRIMIHIDKGGSKAFTRWFFEKLGESGVEYDVIGQSFYSWWHGSLLNLRDTLNYLANTYEKDIFLVETAYNWRPTEYAEGKAPFPESPEGQRDFLEEVNRIVMNVPNGRGVGVFWWEPAVMPGPIYSRGMFDAEGNALPVVNVFDRFTKS